MCGLRAFSACHLLELRARTYASPSSIPECRHLANAGAAKKRFRNSGTFPIASAGQETDKQSQASRPGLVDPYNPSG
jgi:hypothetical protein